MPFQGSILCHHPGLWSYSTVLLLLSFSLGFAAIENSCFVQHLPLKHVGETTFTDPHVQGELFCSPGFPHSEDTLFHGLVHVLGRVS